MREAGDEVIEFAWKDRGKEEVSDVDVERALVGERGRKVGVCTVEGRFC